MPSCRPEVISTILYKIMDMRPHTILDVGAGHGKWGCLAAEYLKYWCNIEPAIDAVEPFGEYESPAWKFYSYMYEGNVLDMSHDVFARYDLVLIVDVIEHIERKFGRLLLESCKNHYIVSTPSYWNPQGCMFGNVLETHISKWSPKDFDNHVIVAGANGRNHIVGWR